MVDAAYADILESEGFVQIGGLNYRVGLHVWWHAAAKLQVIDLPVGSIMLVKGDKSYYMKSISEEGETWARDIPALQSYLETHFTEVHIGFSYFRNVTSRLAEIQIQRRQNVSERETARPSVDHFAELRRRQDANRTQLAQAERLLSLDSGSSDLLNGYVRRRTTELRRDIKTGKKQLKQQREHLSLIENLQHEYERKGSAAAYTFSIGSNTHVVNSPVEFRDAVQSIVKELRDLHRYQVSQKLSGGKLNIHVDEATDPVLVWMEEWFGGALSPRQLDKLGPAFRLLRDATTDHTMVTPNEDVRVSDSVKEDRKLLAARVVSTMVGRLDDHDAAANLSDINENAKPATVGRRMSGGKATNQSAVVPLAKANHVYISGITGSGKSYTGRVLAEEACRYDDLNILILDPRNQAVGMLVPEDRESILERYDAFNIDHTSARGYDFRYFAPGSESLPNLPTDLDTLGQGRSIVSFKALGDRDRCRLFAQILDAVFDAHASEESDTLRLIILIEEAQRFTKKRVSEDAKAAGQQAENALDRTVREGRKYGCCTVILSQTIRDFSYDSASIRQNTNTKIFMRNADREIDYASDFLGDGRQIVKLQTGEAILYNAAWGAMRAGIRPPYSKVWEFSAADTQRLITPTAGNDTQVLSPDAQRLIDLCSAEGQSNGTHLNLTEAGRRLGIGSKRHLQRVVAEVEQAGLIRTRRLPQRGNPRVIEVVSSGRAD